MALISEFLDSWRLLHFWPLDPSFKGLELCRLEVGGSQCGNRVNLSITDAGAK